ncbi:MAG: hypothetical protein K6T76_12570 [Alicyclobacillus mali]|nr:hypothetical protein [Alicyclobacillus mali (ex Roth et al. 2021)]
MIETFGILLHGFEIAEMTGNYARIAGAGDGIDQATGQPVVQELEQAIMQNVPVSSVLTGEILPSAALNAKELVVDIQDNSGETGGVPTQITTTVEYAFEMPLSGWITSVQVPIPMTVTFTYPISPLLGESGAGTGSWGNSSS